MSNDRPTCMSNANFNARAWSGSGVGNVFLYIDYLMLTRLVCYLLINEHKGINVSSTCLERKCMVPSISTYWRL